MIPNLRVPMFLRASANHARFASANGYSCTVEANRNPSRKLQQFDGIVSRISGDAMDILFPCR